MSTIPPGYYYYGASAGREWYIDPANKFKDTSIPEKHLQLLDQVSFYEPLCVVKLLYISLCLPLSIYLFWLTPTYVFSVTEMSTKKAIRFCCSKIFKSILYSFCNIRFRPSDVHLSANPLLVRKSVFRCFKKSNSCWSSRNSECSHGLDQDYRSTTGMSPSRTRISTAR